MTLSVNVSLKSVMLVKYVWNPSTCTFENGTYLKIFVND